MAHVDMSNIDMSNVDMLGIQGKKKKFFLVCFGCLLFYVLFNFNSFENKCLLDDF